MPLFSQGRETETTPGRTAEEDLRRAAILGSLLGFRPSETDVEALRRLREVIEGVELVDGEVVELGYDPAAYDAAPWADIDRWTVDTLEAEEGGEA